MLAQRCMSAVIQTVCTVGSWVVSISLISYTQSAPVFIEHPCLMKLPVSYYRYVQCDAIHVRSCLLSGCRKYGIVRCTPRERTCVSY